MVDHPRQNQTLYTLTPTRRFSERADDYSRYRPGYPETAIAAILTGLNNPQALRVADIGAGTGIAARLLADQGATVLAIEPNDAMRAVATAHPLVTWSSGTAEQTSLPTAAVDLVTCFQAFHWFNPEPTLVEFHRILKLGGRLALVWNERNRSDPFTAAYSELVRIASDDHPAQRMKSSVAVFSGSSLFTEFRHSTFPYRQSLDQQGLIGRVMSVSYVPKAGKALQELLLGLESLYENYKNVRGEVEIAYRTEVYLAERNSLS